MRVPCQCVPCQWTLLLCFDLSDICTLAQPYAGDGISVVNLRVLSSLKTSSSSCSKIWQATSRGHGLCAVAPISPVDASGHAIPALCTLASATALIMQDCNWPTSVLEGATNRTNAAVVELWGANLVILDGLAAAASRQARGRRRAQLDPADSSPSLYWTLYSQDVQSSLYNWTLFVNTSFSSSTTGFFSSYVFNKLLAYASSIDLGFATTAEVDVDPQWQSVPGASFSPTGAFPAGDFPASIPRLLPVWWQSTCGGAILSTSSSAGNSVIRVRGGRRDHDSRSPMTLQYSTSTPCSCSSTWTSVH